MATKHRCPTKLLDDTPADADEFGGHESVARSIAEVVQTEAGGKAIGLEGGWGAGKSTIVKLASKILAETENREHRTVVFDTWAHQDDPLRRSFLEQLITSIQEFDWVDRKEWDRRLAELSRRRSVDTTKVVPKLEDAGLWFAFSLLFVPLGLALIAVVAPLLAANNAFGSLAPVALIVGFVAALAPLILYGSWALSQREKRKSESVGGDHDRSLSELPALLTRQASTESRTIVTRTPDPTSVEFECNFTELLNDALERKNRSLLLVIDNLDRVQPTDALLIWSTLQTFLGPSDYQRADWIERLWVLIPYDGNAILRLWDGAEGDETDATGSALASSFLDKTFQLRFKVPPLLVLDWRGFLQDALQEALPHHRESDFHDVYRAFFAKGRFEATTPTPRDLKIFVNQIGTLHRTWQDEFPLSHLACYVLIQKDPVDVLSALLSETDLELPKRIIGNNWRDIIAALHFGVETQEARQLLLRRPIEVALANGDGANLVQIAVAHPSGFWSVFEDFVPAGAKDWNTVAAAELAKAAIALAESRLLDQDDGRQEAATVRARIQSAVAEVRDWSPFDDVTSRGMVAAARLVGNPEEVVPALLEAASNAPVDARGRSSGDETQRVSPSVWLASALSLIEGLVDHGLGEHIGDAVSVPLDAQQWVDAAHVLAEKDPSCEFLKYLGLHATSEIDELLTQQISHRNFDEPTLYAARAAMATRTGKALKNVATAVLSQLNAGRTFEGNQLTMLLKILRSSRYAGAIESGQYDGFAKGGHCLAHLYQAGSMRPDPEATAECMFAYLVAVPDASRINRGAYSQNGHRTLVQLLQNHPPLTAWRNTSPPSQGKPKNCQLSWKWQLNNSLCPHSWHRCWEHS